VLRNVSRLLRGRRIVACCAPIAVAALFAAPADASQQIDRNARNVKLAVNRQGTALLTYTNVYGKRRHVLVWGAINSRHPNRRVRQVRFRVDYSGGWGTYRRDVWKTFKDACQPYDGPAPLAWLVTACKAPDGTYWAVQAWQVQLPDLGFTPWLPKQRSWQLHISHWSGPLAQLEVYTNWVYSGRFEQLFGRLTYLGQPVHGFGTTWAGAPTDRYGRLLYLDTHNSKYGSGWRRENSFVPHRGTGVFCYGFYPFDPFHGGYTHPPRYRGGKRGPGIGDQYRISVMGPGVTPDIMWQGAGLQHRYDRNNPTDVAFEQQMNAKLDGYRDRLCRKH